jgi:hypothetical protein
VSPTEWENNSAMLALTPGMLPKDAIKCIQTQFPQLQSGNLWWSWWWFTPTTIKKKDSTWMTWRLGLNATTLSANMKHLSSDHASSVSATALGFGPHASQALAE